MTSSVGQTLGVVRPAWTSPAPEDAAPRLQLAQLHPPQAPGPRTDAPVGPQLPSPSAPRPPTAARVADIREAVAQARRSSITLETDGATAIASGVVVEPGFATTAVHFANTSEPIYYEGFDTRGQRVIGKATVLGMAPQLDVALLRLEHTDIAVARFASRPPQHGEPVIITGAPYGLTDSVTLGVVSGVHRNFGGPLCDCFQTDAAINLGNSGGGAFDSEGQLMGQATMVLEGKQNVGFVIPAATLQRLVPRLKKGNFEVTPSDIVLGTPQLGSAYKAGWRTNEGALVTDVTKGSGAARAGVAAGDVLLAVDGQAVAGVADAQTLIALIERGQQYRLLVRRNGQVLPAITVTK